MRDLSALLADPAGRELLAAHEMHVELPSFSAALRPPRNPALNALVGLPGDAALVHIGQQVCADYGPQVATKFEAAAGLAAHGAAPVLLWHDLDRAESERFGMRVVLPTGKRTKGLWFAPRAMGGREIRFVPVDRDHLEGLFAQLGEWAEHAAPEDRVAARARVGALAEAVLSGAPTALGEATGAMATHLLREQLGVVLPATYLSTLMATRVLDGPMDAYLAALDDVVPVVNEAIADLHALDVDPCLRPLDDDHLPLFLSCPDCGTRLRLTRERAGADQYAVGPCRCGTVHRFHLGTTTLSLGELRETDRWSPDVSLPVHHQHIASGWVVGRSTALYGMVFNAVVRRVFDSTPLPGLVPAGLVAEAAEVPATADTLLLGYLTAR